MGINYYRGLSSRTERDEMPRSSAASSSRKDRSSDGGERMTSRVGCPPRTKNRTHDEGLDGGLHAKSGWNRAREPQTPRSSFVVTYMSQRPGLYHTAVLLLSQPETCLTAPKNDSNNSNSISGDRTKKAIPPKI